MPYRKYWLPELIVLLVLMTVSTLVFWLSDLDIATSSHFYFPDNIHEPWPLQNESPWPWFYKYAGVITIMITLGSLVVLATSVVFPRLRYLKIYGIFFLILMVVGPGILVNGIFKDNWGRPRPRDTVELGGNHAYVPPLQMSDAGLKSFPCGHCSVGFTLTATWFVFRRLHPLLAILSFSATMLFGALFGYSRLTAGGHYLSDVMWAFFIPFLTAHVLYYFVLNIPKREDEYQLSDTTVVAVSLQKKILASLVVLVLAAGTIIGALLATPVSFRDSYEAKGEHQSPQAIDITVIDGEIEIARYDQSEPSIDVSIRGFGFPNVKLHSLVDYDESSHTWRYRLDHEGVFTEFRARVKLWLPTSWNRPVRISTHNGDVILHDSIQPDYISKMDITTDHGKVILPQGSVETGASDRK